MKKVEKLLVDAVGEVSVWVIIDGYPCKTLSSRYVKALAEGGRKGGTLKNLDSGKYLIEV